MMNKHIEYFFSVKDEKYSDFSASLIPNISRDEIIGVRLPIIRKYAKEILRDGSYSEFMSLLPHTYHEENLLHAFIIAYMDNYDEVIALTEKFLPNINNWAVCDSFKPKAFVHNKDKVYLKIKEWLRSEHTYAKRFAIVTLMNFFMSDDFASEHIKLVAKTEGNDYYLKMAVAWYFATALTFQYDIAVKVLENKCLDKWTHNKVIQKAIESYRISDDVKNYLKSLKIK